MQDLRQFAKQFVGIPYKLGSLNPEEGLDCATFVLKFFEKYDSFPLNIEIKDEMFKFYEDAPTSSVYHNYIQQYLNLTKYPCYIYPLDILVMKIKELHTEHVGIYLGNNIFIHCNQRGVRLHKVSLCKDQLIYVGKFKDGIRNE
jgi:hypothetical protein